MNLYNLLFYISLIIIIGIACVIGCMVVCGYYIINWVGNDYTKTNQYILDMYGNCTIKKMYIVSEPIQHNGFIFLVNILTGYQYQKVVSSSKNYLPHHTSIILKIKSKNINKFILLEKNNCIQIRDRFYINAYHRIKPVNISNTHTLNSILSTTLNRIGRTKFFDWSVYENNCNAFTKEILHTINKHNNKNIKFISNDEIFEKVAPSKFTINIVNGCARIYNIIENLF